MTPPDIREYAPVANGGLPRFAVGTEFEIGGQRLVVVRVISTTTRPERVTVEVDAVETPRQTAWQT